MRVKRQNVARRDAAATRKRILEAAQEIFSEQSYPLANLRAIAKRADSNVALIARYFGSKEGLFEAALSETIYSDLFTDLEHENVGERLADYFIVNDGRTPNPLPMMIHSTSDPVSKAVALRLIGTRLLRPIAEWLSGADREERAAQILAVTAGFHIYRTSLPLPCFQGEMAPMSRAWLAQVLQDIIDG